MSVLIKTEQFASQPFLHTHADRRSCLHGSNALCATVDGVTHELNRSKKPSFNS